MEKLAVSPIRCLEQRRAGTSPAYTARMARRGLGTTRVTAKQQDEKEDSSRNTGPEVRVVEGAGGQTRPPVVPGCDREESREKGKGESREKDRADRRARLHRFSVLLRARTNAITVSASAGGISRGFNILSVLPVAR